MSSIPVIPDRSDIDAKPTASIPVPATQESPNANVLNSASTSAPSTLKRGRSDVWDTFINLKAEGKAICTRCNKVMSYHPNSGTSALRRHIRTACGRYNGTPDRPVKPFSAVQGGSNPSPLALSSYSANAAFKSESFNNELIKFLLSRQSHFDLIEDRLFKSLIRTLQPSLKLAERSELQERCGAEFEKMKRNLQAKFSAGNFRVSFASDCWTTKQGLKYIFVAAHWIDDNWVLQRRLISFRLLPSLFSQTDLAALLHQTLVDWSLQDRVTSFTIDNTFHTNNTVIQARLLLGHYKLIESIGHDILPTRYGGHIFTAAIKDGLSDASGALEKLRGALRYVRSSASPQRAMREVIENLKLEPTKVDLILDVPECWTSTYLMTENALPFEKVFSCMEIYDSAMPRISMTDWQILRSVCKFLRLLYEAYVAVFGPKLTTANVAFQHLWKVSNHLDHGTSSDDPVIRSLAIKINEHFKRYWERLYPTLGILAILDPRLKTHFVKFCLGRGSPPDSASRPSSAKIERKLKDIFESHYRTERPHFTMLKKSEPYDMEKQEAEEMLEFERSLVASIEEKYETDLARYLAQAPEVGQSRDSGFEILQWWKIHEAGYPDLSVMARDFLSSQIGSVGSDVTFKAAAEIVENHSGDIDDTMLENMVLSQDWIKNS